MALLCAVQYSLLNRRLFRNSFPLPDVITFGGPRLCHANMAEYWMIYCFSPNSIVRNLVHAKDPILQQNQSLWNALRCSICGEEVLCESDVPVVYDWGPNENILIGEGKLSNTKMSFNFWDHCMYLGVFVGPRMV